MSEHEHLLRLAEVILILTQKVVKMSAEFDALKTAVALLDGSVTAAVAKLDAPAPAPVTMFDPAPADVSAMAVTIGALQAKLDAAKPAA